MGLYVHAAFIGFRTPHGAAKKDRRIAVKRINALLLMVLVVATGLFAGYHLWVHNRLDTVGPVISVEEGMLEISVGDPEDALLKGIRAMDDRDGDVTPSILVESVYGITADNMATVTYVAFDRAGNVSKIQRQVRYKDYEPPKFALKGSLTFTYGSGFDLMDYLSAKDVIEGDIGRRVHATLISDTKSIEYEGRHLVKLQVTNNLGDTVEIVLPVEVFDAEWYTADVVLKSYMVYLERGDSFQPKSYLRQFVFRGEPIQAEQFDAQGVEVEISNGVDTTVPGVYEVTYILSKSLNLNTYSGIARLIVVVE